MKSSRAHDQKLESDIAFFVLLSTTDSVNFSSVYALMLSHPFRLNPAVFRLPCLSLHIRSGWGSRLDLYFCVFRITTVAS